MLWLRIFSHPARNTSLRHTRRYQLARALLCVWRSGRILSVGFAIILETTNLASPFIDHLLSLDAFDTSGSPVGLVSWQKQLPVIQQESTCSLPWSQTSLMPASSSIAVARAIHWLLARWPVFRPLWLFHLCRVHWHTD